MALNKNKNKEKYSIVYYNQITTNDRKQKPKISQWVKYIHNNRVNKNGIFFFLLHQSRSHDVFKLVEERTSIKNSLSNENIL